MKKSYKICLRQTKYNHVFVWIKKIFKNVLVNMQVHENFPNVN